MNLTIFQSVSEYLSHLSAVLFYFLAKVYTLMCSSHCRKAVLGQPEFSPSWWGPWSSEIPPLCTARAKAHGVGWSWAHGPSTETDNQAWRQDHREESKPSIWFIAGFFCDTQNSFPFLPKIRHIYYLCEGKICGFGYLWFRISSIHEESQVTGISSLDLDFFSSFNKCPPLSRRYTQALFDRDARDKFCLQKSHLTYKKCHPWKFASLNLLTFLSFYFFLKGTFLPDCLADTTCLPSAINPLLCSNYSWQIFSKRRGLSNLCWHWSRTMALDDAPSWVPQTTQRRHCGQPTETLLADWFWPSNVAGTYKRIITESPLCLELIFTLFLTNWVYFLS